MTLVKFSFALLVLIPVAILMWQILSRLISEFTYSVKESTEKERAREKALKDVKKESINYGRYGERYGGSHIERSEKEKQQGASDMKQMMDKRKRRKERRKKKDKES